MRVSLALLLVTVCAPALAASPAYEKCVGSIDMAGLTGSQRLDCATTDMDRADRQLNDTYREIMARLPPQRRSALRQEERAWIDRRKATCAIERQPAEPSRDVARMLCLVRESDARTEALRAYR